VFDRIAVGYNPANYSTGKYLIFITQTIYINKVVHYSRRIQEIEEELMKSLTAVVPFINFHTKITK
jgi:hypothetical protein